MPARVSCGTELSPTKSARHCWHSSSKLLQQKSMKIWHGPGQKSALSDRPDTCRGERSAKQQCSQCRCVLPTPYLLSVHISEQHDSFFASQAALRMPVFQCLIEGCSTTFTSVGQRHQHLVDLHQIAPDFGFDRYAHSASNKLCS